MLKQNQDKKIVVGMSGGVDSSMVLILLKKMGYTPIGVSLKYCVWDSPKNSLKENVCCTLESFRVAKMVCDRLGVEHVVLDVSSEFHKQVIEYFIKEHKNNFTPSPCIVCNKELKIQELINFAKKEGINYVATGHYGVIKRDKKGEVFLLKAKDKIKDQTYFLSGLTQEQLKYLVLPLGRMLKKNVYDFAKKNKWEIFLKTKQSQDFCFIANKSIPLFLEEKLGNKPGNIVNKEGGEVLGNHLGLHFYTIGQRKGILLPGGPYYVIGFDLNKNDLIVSKEVKDLNNFKIELDSYNIINMGFLKKKKILVKVKVRSQDKLTTGVLEIIDKDRATIQFKKAKRAVSPGQFAVFYKGSVCVGCGRIIKAN